MNTTSQSDVGGAGSPPGERILRGIAVSPGVAVGPIEILSVPEVPAQPRELAPEEVPAEISRFREAVRRTIGEISESRDAMVGELGREGAAIFDAQLLILQDPLAIEATEKAIQSQHRNAEYLFGQNILRVLESFEAMQGVLFKERAADIRDVKRRVLRALTGAEHVAATPARGAIVVSRELAPGDALALSSAMVEGFAAERGGTTAHSAIMARARRIPAVFGIPDLMRIATAGRRCILDGWQGLLVLDPTAEEEQRYERVRQHYEALHERLGLLRQLPSVTQDGREVHLWANIELPMETAAVVESGADGIGLFRTEFFLMERGRLANEEEQRVVYERAVDALAPRPVVFRTMDLGGDKFASYIGADREKNPFLGMRGIRFLLAHEDVLRTQLRAILRASVRGPVRILFPMVTTPEEWTLVRAHVDHVMGELAAEGTAFDPRVPLGIMIETPAAVFMADVLARTCEFFSVGSNDLTQYALAVDRTNAKLGSLFNPLHPSVLRAIHSTVESAHREGCWVSLCGELAGDTLATVLLVGLGLDDLSMSPARLPEVKQLIRTITFPEAEEIAARALRLSTAREVEGLLHEFLRQRFPELVEIRNL
jgi:phosphotransferase system enzyme I (PtsI)